MLKSNVVLSPNRALNANYTMTGGVLGEGSYGRVFDGVNKSTGKNVAIKEMRIEAFDSPDLFKQLFREISILRMLGDHLNIISLEHVIASRNATTGLVDELYLVFEKHSNNLAKIIRHTQAFSTQHIEFLLCQILSGLQYIHSVNVAHRDLKPDNILVNENCHLVICDFGLARATQDLRVKRDAPERHFSHLSPYVVSRYYRSPEVILDSYKDAAAIDMWSVGCILAELILRTPLFPARSSAELLVLIHELIGIPGPSELTWMSPTARDAADAISRSSSTSPANFQIKFATGPELTRDLYENPTALTRILELLRQCLEFTPSNRITARNALRHSFFGEQIRQLAFPTFPLKPVSRENSVSINRYYRLEKELNDLSGTLTEVHSRWISDYIVRQANLYTNSSSASENTLASDQATVVHEEPKSVVPAATASSFSTTRASFFQPSRQDDVVQQEMPTPAACPEASAF